MSKKLVYGNIDFVRINLVILEHFRKIWSQASNQMTTLQQLCFYCISLLIFSFWTTKESPERSLKYRTWNFVLGRKDFELEKDGHNKRESCVSDCSSYGDDPYCAGGKTYKNKCVMYNAVCTDGIAPGTKGACGKIKHILAAPDHGFPWL